MEFLSPITCAMAGPHQMILQTLSNPLSWTLPTPVAGFSEDKREQWFTAGTLEPEHLGFSLASVTFTVFREYALAVLQCSCVSWE